MKKKKKKNIKEDKTMENNVYVNDVNKVEGNTVENTEEITVETTEEVVKTQEEINKVEGEVSENIEETEESVEEVSNEASEEIENEESKSEDNDQENEEPTIEYVEGHITNCEKLYVRKESSRASESLGIIDSTIDLTIDLTNSTEDFYKVVTSNGIEGYCVKEFVKID